MTDTTATRITRIFCCGNVIHVNSVGGDGYLRKAPNVLCAHCGGTQTAYSKWEEHSGTLLVEDERLVS